MNVSQTGKRLLALTLCLVTVLALCAPALAVSYTTVGIVSGNASIFSTVSTTSSVIANVADGAKVAINGKSGNFYRVILDPDAATASYGWILKAAVPKIGSKTSRNVATAIVASAGAASGSASGASSSASGTAGYITNCNSYVNFRATASTSGKKLGTLKKNAVVSILGTSGKFTQVVANGTTGFVSSDYVTSGTPGSAGTSAPSSAPSSSSGKKVAYGDMRVAGDMNYPKLSSSVKRLFTNAQKKYSDAVGYVYSPGGLISQPVRYDAGLKLLANTYNSVSSFYNTMTRNIVVTAHNNRKSSSNMMFHYLHHYQEKALGYTKCQASSCSKSSLSSVKDLNSASNRTWEMPIFGYSKWELWAMYETLESEPKSTINYNVQHLSNASSSAIQTWINFQLGRANATGSQGKVFNSNVRPNDVFLTLYTCGDEYDSATAQSRLYFFFRAVA